MDDNIRVGSEYYGYDAQYLIDIDLRSYYPHVWDEKDLAGHEIRTARTPMRPFGFAAYKVQNDTILQIKRLAVYPSLRRQGIGTRLLRFVLDEAKDMGIKRVTCVIRESNLPACSFLAKHGFRAHLMSNLFEDEDGLIFKLRFDKA